MADTTIPLERNVLSRFSTKDDIEVHVSTIEAYGKRFADVREFIISLDQYGRGVTFPAEKSALHDVIGGLQEILAMAEGDS